MGNLVAWAVIGGALALFAKRGSMAVLIGTIVAIVGAVVNASVLALLAAGVLRALFTRPGQPPSRAELAIPELFAGGVAVACVVSFLLLLRAIGTGRIWPRGW